MKNKTEMELPKRVGLTNDAYILLRNEKKRQKKSMARIINDLINITYGRKQSVSEVRRETGKKASEKP